MPALLAQMMHWAMNLCASVALSPSNGWGIKIFYASVGKLLEVEDDIMTCETGGVIKEEVGRLEVEATGGLRSSLSAPLGSLSASSSSSDLSSPFIRKRTSWSSVVL